MEPISLILTALVEGAVSAALTKGLTDGAIKAAENVVPDIYNSLKDLIKRKFESQGKSESVMILNKYEQKPEKTKSLLEDELKEIGAAEDQEILEMAQKLLDTKKLNSQEAADGKFNLNISGGTVKGLVQQNVGTINQNFT